MSISSQHNSSWIPYAAVSSLTYGVGTFFFGHATADLLESRIVVSLVQLTLGSLMFPFSFWKFSSENELKRASPRDFWNRNKGGLKNMLIALAIIIVTQLAIQLAMFLSTKANANMGIVVSILSVHCVFSAIIAWFLGQRLTYKQVFAMTIIVSGTQMIISGENSQGGQLSLVCMLLTFLGALGITLGAIACAKMGEKVDTWFWLSFRTLGEPVIVLPFALLGLYLQNGSFWLKSSPEMIFASVLGGFFRSTGEISFILSLVYGPVGPASAINSTNNLWVSILDWGVYALPLTMVSTTGIFLVLVGICVNGLCTPKTGLEKSIDTPLLDSEKFTYEDTA